MPGREAVKLMLEYARRPIRQGPSDADLVERAVRNASKPGSPRWVAVRETFAFGSTSAHALCRRFGLDPDEGEANDR